MKPIAIISLFLFAEAVFCAESLPAWNINVRDLACVADIEFEIITNGESDFNNTKIYFWVVFPTSEYIKNHISQFNKNETEIMLRIQPFLSFNMKDEDTKIEKITLNTKTNSYATSIDEDWEYPEHPIHYISGLQAEEIWDEIKSGNEVIITINYPTKTLTTNTFGRHIVPVSKMLDVCRETLLHNK